MLSGPFSIPTFQNNFVLQDLRNVLQFASESCYKLRRPTIIRKCCNPCYKMHNFHLLQNAATPITKCATYYKMPQPLLQNTQVITKCVVITKCRRTQNGITNNSRKTKEITYKRQRREHYLH